MTTLGLLGRVPAFRTAVATGCLPFLFSCQPVENQTHPAAPKVATPTPAAPTPVAPRPPALPPLPISDQSLSLDPHQERPTFSRAGELLEGYFTIMHMQARGHSDEGSMYPDASSTGHLLAGRKQGLWHNYFLAPAAGLDYSETYKDGLLDGPFTVYNADKTVHYHTVFQQGTGLWKEFYADGKPSLTGAYQHGKEQGPWLRYRPDGSVQERLEYDRGRLRGGPGH